MYSNQLLRKDVGYKALTCECRLKVEPHSSYAFFLCLHLFSLLWNSIWYESWKTTNIVLVSCPVRLCVEHLSCNLFCFLVFFFRTVSSHVKYVSQSWTSQIIVNWARFPRVHNFLFLGPDRFYHQPIIPATCPLHLTRGIDPHTHLNRSRPLVRTQIQLTCLFPYFHKKKNPNIFIPIPTNQFWFLFYFIFFFSITLS